MSQTNLKNNPNSSLLKNTRLAKGLSLDIVHESTKIPMDALRAIEEGYSTRILTPFYYRGFIKIYAEFLGLNINEVLDEYKVQTPSKTPIKQPVSSSTNPQKSKSKTKSQGPNMALEQLIEFWRNIWTPKNRTYLFRGVVIIVAIVVLVKMTGCVANFIKSRPKSSKVIVQKDSKQKHSSKKSKPVVDDVPVETKAAPVVDEFQDKPAQHQSDKVTLTVHASKDTWIQVKTDGKVAFQMTMKKGTVENWEADKDIELSGRNIGELDLEVNGKDVGPLGSFNRKAKRVMITKEGLSVKK